MENGDLAKKYVKYDEVVRTIMTNVIVERDRCGCFLLYNFNPADDSNKLYFNVAAIATDLNKEKLYLDMPLKDYIKFKKLFHKKRTNLRWFNIFKKWFLSDDYKTGVSVLMDFICEQLNIEKKLYTDINNEYYGWIEE